MSSHPSRAKRFVLLAAMAWALAVAVPAPAAASAVCPPPPTELGRLIAVDATYTGPLTDEFPPVYGHYAEGAASCWGDTDITVRGFVAGPEGIGGTLEYRIDPIWLADPPGFLSVSDKVDSDGWPAGPFFRVAVKPSMAARFAALKGRWVTVTGHFNDPAAETCVVDQPAQPGVVPTAEQAIQICQTMFVLTAFRADELPPTDTVPTVRPAGSPAPLAAVVLVAFVAGLVALRRVQPGRSGRR